MAKDTFFKMRYFNAIKNGIGDFTTEMYNRQTEGIWDTIKDNVHNFNKAKKYEDKMKALYPTVYEDDEDKEESGKK